MRYFSLFSGIAGFEYGIKKAIQNARFIQQKNSGHKPLSNRATSQHDKGNGLRSIQQKSSKGSKTQHNLANKLGRWKCVGYSEINKYAIQIYKKHFPKCKNYGDATRIIPEELPDFDLFTFGWPCQDNSIAGKRKGQGADTRSGLLFEAVRILRVKKPKYFIAENVEGLFSVNKGRDFYTTIRMFADAGYDCQWQVLNTRWFLPQNRKRIYFVGHIRGQCRPKIFPIEESNSVNDKNQRRQKKEKSRASCLTSRYGQRWTDETYVKCKQIGQVGKKDNMGQRIYDTKGISVSIRARGGGQGAKTGLYIIKRHRKNEIRNHKQTCPALTESHEHHGGANVPMVCAVLTPDREKKRQHGRRMKKNGEPMFTLTGQDIHGIMVINKQTSGRGKGKIEERFRKGFGQVGTQSGGNVRQEETLIYNNMSIRRLTPTECERLQGFPDGWTEWGIDENGKKIKISDTQRYRTLGNAVTTDVVAEIVKRLIQNL